MPLFEYECRKCRKVSEILVGVGADRTAPACAHCGSRSLEKLFSAPARRRASNGGGGGGCGGCSTKSAGKCRSCSCG